MDMFQMILMGGGAAAAAGIGHAVYEQVNDIRRDPKTGFKYREADKVYVGQKAKAAGLAGQTVGQTQRRAANPGSRRLPADHDSRTWTGRPEDKPARPGMKRPTGRPTQYGKAGGAIGENTKFNAYATAAGAKGEAMLGQTMMAFFSKHKVPARIYHGVYFPGSKAADIDHVVVIGRAVYLIDAKLYKADNYFLSADRNYISSGRGDRKRTRMGAAGEKTVTALGSRGQVRGVRICILSVGRNESRVTQSGGMLDVCSPPQLLQEILRDISSGEGMNLANQDGSKAMRYFQGQLK